MGPDVQKGAAREPEHELAFGESGVTGSDSDMREATMRHDVQAELAAELEWDPKVDSGDITVAAHGGAVALWGSVGTVWHMRQAQNAARRVRGVTSVGNHLNVRTVNWGPGEDAEVRTAVLHALMLNATIPATIQADAVNGIVRLTGTATWQYEREEAEYVCGAVPGVLGIADEITLIPVPASKDIQQSIISAYRRNARLTMQVLSVDASASGIVILSGTVPSWAEHEEALAAAWSAPGLTRVDDRILVIY